MAVEKIIETVNLTKRYKNQKAVEDLNLTVNQGEIFGFLGPNGAGKTTTLLMLLGLTQASAGSARVCNINPFRKPRDVKSLVGYLPENVGFYEDLDAIQSLEYIAELNGKGKKETSEKIPELLNLIGLTRDPRKKTAAHSRGMRQRLGIAEVLMKDPSVLFLDEPTLGLDPEGALQLIELIGSLNRDKGLTILISSHNLHQVQQISHRVGIMIEGRMMAEGSIQSLAEKKFGIGKKNYTLEEIYMEYFKEG